MGTAFLVYVLMTLPKLAFYFGFVALVSAIVAVVLHGVICCDWAHQKYHDEETNAINKNKREKGSKFRNKLLSFVVLSSLLAVIIPDKTTTYVLAGAYIAEKTVNSEIGQDVIALVHKNIKEALKEEVK